MREEDKKGEDTVKNTINLMGVAEATEFGSQRSSKISIKTLQELRDAIKQTKTGIIAVPLGQEKEFFKSCGIDTETKKTSLVNRINAAHRVDGLGLIAKLDAGNIKIKAL